MTTYAEAIRALIEQAEDLVAQPPMPTDLEDIEKWCQEAHVLRENIEHMERRLSEATKVEVMLNVADSEKTSYIYGRAIQGETEVYWSAQETSTNGIWWVQAEGAQASFLRYLVGALHRER
jgi:hypothetical protein